MYQELLYTVEDPIATMLGGQLAVESTLGRGSVFRLVLPAATTENPRP